MPTGVGAKIKYFRMKHGLTQEELADGVVSISYLSKIERNGADPNPNAVKQLCKRLGISPEKLVDETVSRDLECWKKALLNRELTEAHRLYLVLDQKIEAIIDADLFWLMELHRLYYFILTKRKDESTEQYKTLLNEQQQFSKVEHYYWLKFQAHYHYMYSSYEEAFIGFDKAEKIFNQTFYENPFEYHDLIYQYAKTASVLHYTYHATIFVERALSFYRENYELRRAAKCHILTGISYKRMREMDQALRSFEFAIKLAKEIKDERIHFAAYEALGELYLDLGVFDKAIKYYDFSYQMVKHHYSIDELKAVLGLIKTYQRMKQLPEAIKWHSKALEIIKNEADLPPRFVYEIKVLYYELHGFDKSFEQLMEKEVLPFFRQRNLYMPYSNYMQLIANYYYENRKYKQAAERYREAQKAIKDIQTVDNNEVQ